MPYDAYVADGSEVKVTITSTKTLINGCKSFAFGGSSKPTTIPFTAINDTAAKKKTGRMDYGTLTLPIYFDPTDTVHTYLMTQANTPGTADHFDIKLTTTPAQYIHCDGSIQSFDITGESQNVYQVNVVVAISGAITINATP
jgi:hypothetical protein